MTHLQVERIKLRREKDGQQQNNGEVMGKGRRPLPLERCPIVWRKLAENPFGLGAYASRLAETTPYIMLFRVRHARPTRRLTYLDLKVLTGLHP